MYCIIPISSQSVNLTKNTLEISDFKEMNDVDLFIINICK